MRNNATDNYNSVSLIGNNSYHICFMNYLFSTQGVKTLYSNKYKIHDVSKENILKNIAVFFGTQGPVLIDNDGLLRLFSKYKIPNISDIQVFSSVDIINQLEICLQSDFVYVCNCNGELDKYMMFILGFLMAKNVELCFWNEIDRSEWLISCMSDEKRTIGEVVQYPLEIIRNLAYPYLFKKLKSDLKPGKYGKLIVDKSGKCGVDTKSDFDLNICNQTANENTVSILGSLRKQLNSIYENSIRLQKNGYKVLAPKISSVKRDENGFVVFDDDISDDPTIIEKDFLEQCLKAEYIFVCDKDGYIGNTVAFEIGYLLANHKDIKFLEEPKDKWIPDIVNYYLNIDKSNQSLKEDDAR